MKQNEQAVKPFNIVFKGKIAQGFTFQQVKTQLATHMNLSDAAIERLFNPQEKAVTVKKASTLAQAQKYCEHFLRLGMVLEVEESALAVKPTNDQQPEENASIAHPAQQAEAADADDVQLDNAPQSRLQAMLWLLSYYKPTILLVTFGIILTLAYSPIPHGYLKIGFLIGSTLLFFGYRSFRARY